MNRARIFFFSIALLGLLCLSFARTAPTSASGQLRVESVKKVTPAAEQLLAIDDGMANDGVGGSGNPGFGWFNQLKPDFYPATLKEVQVAFNNSQRGVQSGSPFRIVVYIDPEND